MEEVILRIPDHRALSRNQIDRMHWSQYRLAKQDHVILVKSATQKRTPFKNPVSITIEAYYKGKVHVDTSNIDDKFWVDALMHVDILSDDNAICNPEVIKRSHYEAGKDEVVIKIRQIGN